MAPDRARRYTADADLLERAVLVLARYESGTSHAYWQLRHLARRLREQAEQERIEGGWAGAGWSITAQEADEIVRESEGWEAG